MAILIGVEGGHAIEGSLEKLRELYALGARYLTLTWNNGNDWAGSSIGSGGTRTTGLTTFGRDVIREMNRLGMLVDVSHVSDATLVDVLEVADVPIIASHSSARALSDHPRNLRDDQLRAIAGTGGVVSVNFYPRFLDPRFRVDMDALEREEQAGGHPPPDESPEAARRWRARVAGLHPTPLSVLIDHIAHMADTAGVEHVGLGSDFDGVSALPEGLEDVTGLPVLAQSLLDRGFADAEITGILGGNLMRVMTQVLDGGAPDA